MLWMAELVVKNDPHAVYSFAQNIINDSLPNNDTYCKSEEKLCRKWRRKKNKKKCETKMISFLLLLVRWMVSLSGKYRKNCGFVAAAAADAVTINNSSSRLLFFRFVLCFVVKGQSIECERYALDQLWKLCLWSRLQIDSNVLRFN